MPNRDTVNIVIDDIVNGLPGFGRRPDFEEDPVIVHPQLDDGEPEQPIQPLTAVPWIYRCVHNGDFQGLVPTGRELEIHGVTFVDGRAGTGDPQLYRYVDWIGVVNQLGLDVSWRVPIDETQYRAIRDQIIAERDEEAEDEEAEEEEAED